MFSWLKAKKGPPDAAAVMKRVIILKYLFVKALTVPPPEYLSAAMGEWSEEETKKFESDWKKKFSDLGTALRDRGLWSEMNQDERNFIDAGPSGVTKQSLIDASWLVESIVSLLWALGYLAELPPYDQQANPDLTNQLPNQSYEELISAAKLRPKEEIQKQRDVAELWNWRARTRRLQESGELPALIGGKFTIDEVLRMTSTRASEAGDIPAPIDGDFPAFGKAYRHLSAEEFKSASSIAQERHHAFNWLCGYAPANRWAETPTDT